MSPVHDAYGKKDLIPATHRCAMLRLALRSSDWIKLSDWEVNQEGWTKTKYLLQYHQVNKNQYFLIVASFGLIMIHIFQNYLNAFIKARKNGTFEGSPPSWMPDVMTPVYNNNIGIDETDSINSNYDMINGNEDDTYSQDKIRLKLLCGGDLLESFATPGLWAPEDVSLKCFFF